MKVRTYFLVVAIALFCGIMGAVGYQYIAQQGATSPGSTRLLSTGADERFFVPASMPSTPQERVDLTQAAEVACDAVVYVRVVSGGETRTIHYIDPFEEMFGGAWGEHRGHSRQVQTPKQESAGSGVIISADGYIVTNNHVVEGAHEVTVTLNDNREFTASIVGLDATTDLALLKVEAEGLPAIPVGDSDALKVGEWVLAVGNPFNLTSTVTAGIVSAKARNVGANRNGIESFIQTDAAINQGNSGGALVNARGELVGINAMLYSQTGSFTGYGFAIPVSIMKKVVTDLRTYGSVQRAMIGISGMDLLSYVDSQKHRDSGYTPQFGTLDGVYVAEVLTGGAAAQAGVLAGDVIVSLDGKHVSKMSELQEATTRYNPEEEAELGFYRDGSLQSVRIRFGRDSRSE